MLVDPSNDEIRYVGKTKHTLEHRLKGHLSTSNNKEMKSRTCN